MRIERKNTSRERTWKEECQLTTHGKRGATTVETEKAIIGGRLIVLPSLPNKIREAKIRGGRCAALGSGL